MAYAGRALGDGVIGEADPVAESAVEALEWYAWFRVVEAGDELEAIENANREHDSLPAKGEVYFVTPFVQGDSEKVEVIV